MFSLELITIYLAVGASFAVSQGWRGGQPFAFGAALRGLVIWPWAAARWFTQKRAMSVLATGKGNEPGPETRAQRATQIALTELSRVLPSFMSVADTEQLWQQCRAALEKYTELTATVNNLDETASLGPRATELFLLDKRDGLDLARAARCLQRRNAARLKAHQIQARQEFLRALQDTQRVVTKALAHAPQDLARAVYVEELWHGFIERARQLCLALQDTETAQKVTRRLADAHAYRARPAVPALNKITPPQLEVEICTPETNLPFTNMPAGMTTRLG